MVICGNCQKEISVKATDLSKCSSLGFIVLNDDLFDVDNMQEQFTADSNIGTSIFERQIATAIVQQREKYMRLCCECYFQIEGGNELIFFNQDACLQCNALRNQRKDLELQARSESSGSSMNSQSSALPARTPRSSYSSAPTSRAQSPTRSARGTKSRAQSPTRSARGTKSTAARGTPVSAAEAAADAAEAAPCASFGFLHDAPEEIAAEAVAARHSTAEGATPG